MTDKVFEDQTFDGKGLNLIKLERGKYDNCVFLNCDFSNADLGYMVFVECQFDRCNLTMAKIIDTAFRVVEFTDCKLLGLAFDSCSNFLLALSFMRCELNLASFQGLKLKGTHWRESSLKEVDFTNADVTNALFDQCDLERTIFDGTKMEGADFRKAYNYNIDPDINRVKGAKFSSTGLSGLLEKYRLHIE